MNIRYEERNGRKYAYRCTSRREPGKKYPVSKKEYLGVVDPETGNLIPKKVETDSLKFGLQDGKFRMKNYGGSMIVDTVAKRIHLREDLKASFVMPRTACSYWPLARPWRRQRSWIPL